MKNSLKFSIELSSTHIEKLIDIVQDYKNITKLFPGKMSCRILEKTKDEIITEETIYISKLHYKLKNKSSHKKTSKNSIQTSIIDGPLKNSLIQIFFEKTDFGTKINVAADLKLSFKLRFLSSFIKKRYQYLITGFLNQINAISIAAANASWNDCLVSDGDALIVSKNNIKYKLYGWWLCTLRSCFIDDDYEFLPVEGKTVIDIGANVGDTILYFAARNASKIIALEPFPLMYELSLRNIKENNLTNVTLLQEGCSNKEDKMKIDPETSNVGAILEETTDGINVNITTLENILDKYEINSAVLKMNCEGCEYDSILHTSSDTLRKFSHILIAYHDTFEKLEKKLKESNFEVIIKKHSQYENQGWIMATKI